MGSLICRIACNRVYLLLFSLLWLCSCALPQDKLPPRITSEPSSQALRMLPTAFPPLSPEESASSWGMELFLGEHFAREGDFYRAITAFKRGLALFSAEKNQDALRRQQMEQGIVLSYYLGKKYQEAIDFFETSTLQDVGVKYPGLQTLLLTIYHSYIELHREPKADIILCKIESLSPDTAEDLRLFQRLQGGEVMALEKDPLLWKEYRRLEKSPRTARISNAIVPGAGYWYVGQKKSAVTSFLINTLFTAAAYQFFHQGYPAAGAIVASMEMGWYLGGIHGAGLEAEYYNHRLYEKAAVRLLREKQAFPFLMWETSF